jgi:uncharacterized protein
MGTALGEAHIIDRALNDGQPALQFTKETSQANLIRAWELGRVLIGERWFTGNLVLSAERIVEDWVARGPSDLSVDDLAAAIDMRPEIILIGAGESTVLPDIDLMAALAAQAIGLEIMKTSAACRTFNVLVHEQRRVVAVLFNETPRSTG